MFVARPVHMLVAEWIALIAHQFDFFVNFLPGFVSKKAAETRTSRHGAAHLKRNFEKAPGFDPVDAEKAFIACKGIYNIIEQSL